MKLNLITWNLWNSFKAVKSPIEIEFLEPLPRIRSRHHKQNELLSDASIDLALLQEVNPIRLRLKDFKNTFKHSNYQVDQGGLKLFGKGLPLNFENALLTASKHRLKLIKAVKLSPEPGFNHRYFSLQWLELRYALFSELYLYDKRILIVNTHLHHGIEWTKELKTKIEKAYEEKQISQQDYDNLLLGISQSTYRKQNELNKLISALKIEMQHYHYIILGGDFNMSSDSPYFDALRALNLQQVSLTKGHTFCGFENDANIIYSNQLKPPVKDISQQTIQILNENNKKSRNLDHFFITKNIEVESVEIFAKEKLDKGFYPSDHFGLKVGVILD